MKKLFHRVRLWLMPDKVATAIKRQIRDARKAHRSVNHLAASLVALRHDQLRKAVGQ